MKVEDLTGFEKGFNKTSRSIGDLINVSKAHNIPIELFSDPRETSTEFIWEIGSLGTFYQCKDCKAIEFVETGKEQIYKCDK